jgi:hypothetical protein
MENPFHVSLQALESLTYRASIARLTASEMALMSAASLLPMPALNTSAQHTARWQSAVAPELATRGRTRLQRHVHGGRRDEPPRVGAGLGGDARVLLAEEQQDPAGVRPHEGDGDAGEPENKHGALLVDAQQVVLPRAERLPGPAERVQRGRHAGLQQSACPCLRSKYQKRTEVLKSRCNNG